MNASDQFITKRAKFQPNSNNQPTKTGARTN